MIWGEKIPMGLLKYLADNKTKESANLRAKLKQINIGSNNDFYCLFGTPLRPNVGERVEWPTVKKKRPPPHPTHHMAPYKSPTEPARQSRPTGIQRLFFNSVIRSHAAPHPQPPPLPLAAPQHNEISFPHPHNPHTHTHPTSPTLTSPPAQSPSNLISPLYKWAPKWDTLI